MNSRTAASVRTTLCAHEVAELRREPVPAACLLLPVRRNPRGALGGRLRLALNHFSEMPQLLRMVTERPLVLAAAEPAGLASEAFLHALQELAADLAFAA
jgi:hypothetical protein